MTTVQLGRDAAQISYGDLTANIASGQTLSDPQYPSLNGYRVEQIFGTTGAGVTAYALRNSAGNIVIAFRGSGSIIGDTTDWSDNVGNLGWRQWQEIRADVNNYLSTNWSGGEVTFAGHSLGGALAQYAAYEVAANNPSSTGSLNLFTYNGLGAQNGINENVAGGFDASVMDGVNASHFFNPEDVVPRLGGGHLGGQTFVVADARPGADGTLTAHSGDQFTNNVLSGSQTGSPDYYQNPISQQHPERFAELLDAYGDVISGGPPSVAELLRLADAVRSLPVDENGETARLLGDIGAGLAAEGFNRAAEFGEDVVDALVDVGRAVVDRVVNAVDVAVDLGIDVVGSIVRGTVGALTAVGQAGLGLLDYLGNALDNAVRWLGGAADAFADALRAQLVRLIDPIVLDLDGNGIELTSRVNSNVYFDMDGDGIEELTGWVSPTDGLLAIDGNANGQIDNINELIGDLGRSGFAELTTYDLNNDRVINSSDAVWSQLRVWIDGDSDGLTDAGELRTLASLSIRSIDLNFTPVNFTAEGNQIHEQSVFEYTNGTTGLVADIWFDVSNVATNSTVGLTGNVTIDDLPDIRGRGDVESLRSAMLTDSALTTLVASITSLQPNQLGNARSQVEQIIFRWADVQNVSPSSRGGLFDGRKLAALEAFLGTEFIVEGIANPNAQAVPSLTEAWAGLVDGIMARLLLGGPLGDALTNSAVYVPEIDRLLTVQTPEELFSSLSALAPSGDGLTVAGFWAAVLPLAREIVQDVGGATDTSEYADVVSAALQNYGLSSVSNLLNNGIQSVAAGIEVLSTDGAFRLGSGNDQLSLTGGQQALFAADGDDRIEVVHEGTASILLDGGAGADFLSGTAGNDWLDGGIGADTLIGGLGDDTYTVDNLGDVVVEGVDGGTDTVRSSLTYVLAANIENLTLLGALAINGIGNADANYLIGNGAVNRLEGLDGNDTLDGGAGADTLVGGLGDDLYFVNNTGDVTIETGVGNDLVQSSVNFTLANRIENLILTGAAVSGTGNGLNNTLTGNAENNTLDGGAGADVLIGGTGNDIYNVDNESDQIIEEDAAGTDRVNASINYGLNLHIENLVLTGSLDINGTGNELANMITGNAGDNQIDGSAGADTMAGGAGDDTYHIETIGDVVTEALDAGTDLVRTSLAAYTLATNVENLQLFINGDDGVARNGTGNELGNRITGTSARNTLTGLGGADTLDGGAGIDSLVGGDGNDVYFASIATEVIVETNASMAIGGNDLVVYSGASALTLSLNVESLTLTGFSTSSGIGNTLNNVLTGNSSNNQLDGGIGADTLIGGLGDDTYTVDNLGDVVVEGVDGGTDTVRSSLTYVLAANIENLTLLGALAINGIGNADANYLIGNGAVNRLEGLDGNDTLDGGAGADTLVGGLGDDLYFVNNTGDVTIETGVGNDTVQSSVNFTLASRIENLILTGSAVFGTGNGLNNTLTGNAGNNTLDGGAGADVLIGGTGDDIYNVDNESDQIIEEDAAGTDRVNASINYGLNLHIENLVLTGSLDVNGTGNELANMITGNAGDNQIDGSAGADTMAGGAGDDTYHIETIGDVVTEALDAGTDLVRTSLAAYTLATNVENLQLFINGDDGVARNGTGNELGNRITGTSARNTLTGLGGADTLDGGAGIDSLVGGDGNDVYFASIATEVIVETNASMAIGGNDLVVYSGASALTLSLNVESLTLTGFSTSSGIGNTLNNVLTGNSSNNQLDGGIGADTLIGGLGDDTYTVDNLGDVVVEGVDGGTDTVRSSLTYVLAANIENLTLLGALAINGIGNADANYLIGNGAVNRLEGLDGNDTLDGGAGADTLVGGLGDDLYFVNNTGDVTIETGVGNDLVQSSVNFTLANRIENLILTGAAVSGTGNGLNNTLTGNAENNTLDGGAGADVLIGGTGNDIYNVDNESDQIIEEDAAGTDRVNASINYGLNLHIENLVLTGSLDINGTGNELANMITGNAGDNQIDGSAGADTMAGGAGDDTYHIETIGDVVTEALDAGTDLVRTSLAAYTLATNVENLQLFISGDDGVARNGTGNELGNRITGTSGANIITGLSGKDSLFGGFGADTLVGGEGDDVLDGESENDRMEGGAGNDTYIVDLATDVLVEAANAGTDTVHSSVSWILGSNLENLTLTNFGALDGQGNALNNVLTGNSSNNQLDGGAGSDTLTGGAGDDTYTVDNTGDVVFEVPGSGTDTVRTSISYVLGGSIENLVLIGTGSINGTGNFLNNSIIGNSGANQLIGNDGIDTLDGGAGDDNLRGGSGADELIGGSGVDFASYYFDAAVTVSLDGSLVATGAAAGDTFSSIENVSGSNTGNDMILGNASANQLNGNGGNDTLLGGDGDDVLKGGLGNDALSGNGGADKFVFDTALNGTTNVDTISTVSSLDKIVLDNDIFTALGASFTADEFRSIDTGTSFASVDASDNIIYLKSTGQLFYDRDGSGLLYSRILFADLTDNTVINFGHFLMVE